MSRCASQRFSAQVTAQARCSVRRSGSVLTDLARKSSVKSQSLKVALELPEQVPLGLLHRRLVDALASTDVFQLSGVPTSRMRFIGMDISSRYRDWSTKRECQLARGLYHLCPSLPGLIVHHGEERVITRKDLEYVSSFSDEALIDRRQRTVKWAGKTGVVGRTFASPR